MNELDDEAWDRYTNLLSAVIDAARLDVEKVTVAVIDALRAANAIGVVGGIIPRHLWDEYCWLLQEESMYSLNEKFGETIRAYIEAEVENLPKHTKIFLTAYAYDYGPGNWDSEPGRTNIQAVIELIEERVQERTARRYLDLIGPDRADAMQMHTGPGGLVCAALSRADLLWNILSTHLDEFICNADESELRPIGERLLQEYLVLVAADCVVAADFFDAMQKSVSSMLLENDIMPALEDLVGEIQELLDS